jgi:hypothetical protein
LTEERRDEPRRQDAETNSTGVAELLLAELLPLCWAAFDGVDGTVIATNTKGSQIATSWQ